MRGPTPLDSSQGGVQLNTGGVGGGVGVGGWAPAGRLEPQPRSSHGGRRFKTLAQLLQRLAALAHQVLAALQGEVVVVAEMRAQGLQPLPLVRPQACGRLAQAGGKKVTEALSPPLHIAKAAIHFQLQSLLQAPQPVLQFCCQLLVAGPGGSGGNRFQAWMSCSHSCSASRVASRARSRVDSWAILRNSRCAC